MKKLPIGIQSFEIIRSEPHYYVDKTLFIKKLMDTGKYYFLSRPRRFGKSLFLDTLRQAFLGKKEYFKGLFLENNWDWNTVHPVIRISFGSGVFRSMEELRTKIDSILTDIKNEFLIEYEKNAVNDRLMEAIVKISRKTGLNVVILVDEYDKPILDCIENKELAIKIREELKNLYSVFKDADAHLKFVFITGVSKFSKVSLFSGLNNLNDITIDSRYSALCGYTHDDVEEVFKDQMISVDKEKFRAWYNGYAWLGEKVYNPFDVLLFFDKKEFQPYWFETATPTFLIQLMGKQQYFVPSMEDIVLGRELIGSLDVDMIYVENLLFQTGYLTIKEKMPGEGMIRFRMGYPNLEVKYSLTNYFLNYLVQDYRKKENIRSNLYTCFEQEKPEAMEDIFQSFFASIPHDWYRKNQLAGYEGYYASIFYCYFAASGFDVKAEDATGHGRMDMSVFYKDTVYIFEFKVIENSTKGRAMEQLHGKQYHRKYAKEGTVIYLIAVEFSKEDRNIKNFEVRSLP
ncbi:PD-(D/E)XK nuclease superfamily protein [Desulfobotulus alkaliphilus]|uniref:PD-(D/E)XK nuclease superfamily protein n=1 Tax=Desulfobotulus alkaliphilus TaxID=622671 RepID=A0A562RR95_9BACT|nr:ATP-binding protein [Desulfobotulus alkaliphilus]TWI71589.1 PD-(D/E)XK nuclease superfamily protein [Desulfobotulus alkaliphilus]